jgi:hypothetical protein
MLEPINILLEFFMELCIFRMAGQELFGHDIELGDRGADLLDRLVDGRLEGSVAEVEQGDDRIDISLSLKIGQSVSQSVRKEARRRVSSKLALHTSSFFIE